MLVIEAREGGVVGGGGGGDQGLGVGVEVVWEGGIDRSSNCALCPQAYKRARMRGSDVFVLFVFVFQKRKNCLHRNKKQQQNKQTNKKGRPNFSKSVITPLFFLFFFFSFSSSSLSLFLLFFGATSSPLHLSNISAPFISAIMFLLGRCHVFVRDHNFVEQVREMLRE